MSDRERELFRFIEESNRIEGITGVTPAEIEAHIRLLDTRRPGVEDMEAFVAAVQPGAFLRTAPGMDVRVGQHRPPPGGPKIETALEAILNEAVHGADPYLVHYRYEQLHPFMDGNGRSGRALWLWQMFQADSGETCLQLGFLHAWYYQSLQQGRP